MANYKITDRIVKTRTNSIKEAETNENVLATDVKLPDDSPARVKVLKAEGKKWYVTVVYHDGSERPFALFCTTNHPEKNAQTSDAVDNLLVLAKEKGILEEHILKLVEKIQHENNVKKLTRVISLLLRHGVAIKNIVRVLDGVKNVYVGSFLFQIKKFLSQYIRDGEKAEGITCSNCGSSKVIYSEGCTQCLECGSSKCG